MGTKPEHEARVVSSSREGYQPDGRYRISERILVATRAYPPRASGSAVIMKNLLNHISPESIVLARSWPLEGMDACRDSHEQHFVLRETRLRYRLERYRRIVLRPIVRTRLVRLARQHGCCAVLGVYPDILFLDVAQGAAAELDLPFIPYLHDTVAEGMSAGSFAWWGRQVQKRVFRTASEIFVATEGMEHLYKRKYGVLAKTVAHIYPEPISATGPPEGECQKTFFWAGAVYEINSHAVARVYRAIEKFGSDYHMVVATKQSKAALAKLGLHGKRLETTYIPLSERPRYLRTLTNQGILVLALSWPDESRIHEDELSTIFPTKTPEYLASGRPIMVHCPDHYYLARFFQENRCGEVVSDRSTGALEMAVKRLLTSGSYRRELGLRSMEAVRQFSPMVVLPRFVDAMERAIATR